MNERNRMLKVIERLEKSRGKHTGMVSFYAPSKSTMVEPRAYIRKELAESENIKDKGNRKNVLSSLSAIFS
ncbi:MAG: hypothetical protein ACFFCS_07330 [Candidatus Hodarchaeota archaeon]